MAEPRRAREGIPLLALLLLLLVAAVIGGIVARMLPIGTSSAVEPRTLAVPTEDSLSPLV